MQSPKSYTACKDKLITIGDFLSRLRIKILAVILENWPFCHFSDANDTKVVISQNIDVGGL